MVIGFFAVMILLGQGLRDNAVAPQPQNIPLAPPPAAPVPAVAPVKVRLSAPVHSPIGVDAVNSAVFGENLTLKASGPAVFRLEILLDRAKYSPGEMDGVFGRNMAQAVIAYRRERGLPLDPVVEGDLWSRLNADQGPLFVDYAIEKADVAGPFLPVPGDMLGKSRLKRLGYGSPAELLGEKFHVNPKVLEELNPGLDLTQEGTVLKVPNVLTPPPARPASLCINATDLTLQGLDAGGHILMSYPVSVGSSHDPLPVGQWQIVAVHMNPVYSYDSMRFWDSKGPRSRAKVAPGPNNPVGVVWIGISKNHYGIHGTPSPNLIGRGKSHGCIRMTNWSAAELANLVGPNLNVVLKAE